MIPSDHRGAATEAGSGSPERAPAADPERWYRVVDIGVHVRRGASAPTTVAEDELVRWFERQGLTSQLTPAGKQHFGSLAEGLAPEAPDVHAGDRNYRPLDGELSVVVSSFSDRHVELRVLRRTGASRWHHYFDLVDELLVARTVAVDERLGLVALHAQYALQVCGVGHGARLGDVIAKLGPQWQEYPGQSPSFRRLYFARCEATAVVQDDIVMYFEPGRPTWLEQAAPPAR